MKAVIAGGGTGGHVFPALALAIELTGLGVEVTWAGRESGIEREVARDSRLRFEPVAAAGLLGKGLGAKALGLLQLGRGAAQALGLLSRLDPHAVVGCGGYASAPTLAAAQLQGRKYFLLEQNRVPGRVTRLFAPQATAVFAAFPPVTDYGWRLEVTGNPLRAECARVRRADDGRTVLVLGGSGGARVLNMAALDAAAALTNQNFVVLTGRRDYTMIKSLVRTHNVELVEFASRPEELYRRATIAVSRAGGLVLSELLSSGIPAIIIPLPHATDGHQDANAQYLASIGAAVVLDQARLSGLTVEIRKLLDDEPRRRQMAEAAGKAARPDAAAVVARRIVECSAA